MLVHIGVIFALVAVAFSGLVLPGFFITIAIMGSPGLDSAAITALLQKVISDPVGTPILLGFFLAGIAFFLIGLAVWRSGFAYRWVGPLIAIAVVADFIPVHNEIVTVLVSALQVIGPAAIGYRLLTMSDEEWESGKTADARSAAPLQAHAPHPSPLP